jgi:hypothetical protein
MGLFLPPLITLGFIVVHQLHVKIFKGCILTNYQVRMKGLSESTDFIQFALRRLFRLQVTTHSSKLVNYGILVVCFSLSVYRFGFTLF